MSAARRCGHSSPPFCLRYWKNSTLWVQEHWGHLFELSWPKLGLFKELRGDEGEGKALHRLNESDQSRKRRHYLQYSFLGRYDYRLFSLNYQEFQSRQTNILENVWDQF